MSFNKGGGGLIIIWCDTKIYFHFRNFHFLEGGPTTKWRDTKIYLHFLRGSCNKMMWHKIISILDQSANFRNLIIKILIIKIYVFKVRIVIQFRKFDTNIYALSSLIRKGLKIDFFSERKKKSMWMQIYDYYVVIFFFSLVIIIK